MLLAPSRVAEPLGDVGAAPGDFEDGLAAGVLHLGPDSMVVVASLKVRAEGFGNKRASQEFQWDVVAFGTGAQVSPEIGAGLEEILGFSPALLVESIPAHAACDVGLRRGLFTSGAAVLVMGGKTVVTVGGYEGLAHISGEWQADEFPAPGAQGDAVRLDDWVPPRERRLV